MSVWFELIAASDGAALVDRCSVDALPPASVIATKILDPVTLAMLHAVILQSTYEDVLPHYQTPMIEQDDWLWIHRLPDTLMSGLARLDEAGLARVAREWAASEEIRIHPELDEAFVRTLVADIRQLAAQAVADGQGLFLRISL